MVRRAITSREWTSIYEITKKDIIKKLTSGAILIKEVESVEAVITDLDAQLKVFAASPIQHEISVSEIARRKVILKNLSRHLHVLRETSKLSAKESQRGADVTGRSYTAPTPGSTNNNNSVGKEGIVSSSEKSSSNGNIAIATVASGGGQVQLQRQRDIMRLQDEMLLDISAGVGRLHNQAVAIGDETKVHVRLLDSIDDDVENATAALQSSSRHVERVKNATNNSLWMYLCIGAEIVIIFILLVVALSR